ncbi:MAG: hypothetical protein K2O96_00565 [Lachnospiraceae bacterium]|nr:hypothetical protein [Lachnospiraceae bacterium]
MYSCQYHMQTRKQEKVNYSGMDPNPYLRKTDPTYSQHKTDPWRNKTPHASSGGEMHHIIPLNIAHMHENYFNENNVNQPWNLIELDGAPGTNLMIPPSPNVFHRATAATLHHNAYDNRVRMRPLRSLAQAITAAGAIRQQIVNHPLNIPKDNLENSGIG